MRRIVESSTDSDEEIFSQPFRELRSFDILETSENSEASVCSLFKSGGNNRGSLLGQREAHAVLFPSAVTTMPSAARRSVCGPKARDWRFGTGGLSA